MVHIYKVKKGDEVRRFKIDLARFDDLENKVRSFFNISTGQRLTLKWQDESNDWITVSSDDELVDALAHKKQEALTLLLSVDGAHLEQHTTTTSSSVNDQPHVGIICDVCETSPVTGTRFKCRQCPDFDLCHTCFLSNHHSEHDMMVIRRPRGPRLGRFGRKGCHRGGRMGNLFPSFPMEHLFSSSHHGSQEPEKTCDQPTSPTNCTKPPCSTTNPEMSHEDFDAHLAQMMAACMDEEPNEDGFVTFKPEWLHNLFRTTFQTYFPQQKPNESSENSSEQKSHETPSQGLYPEVPKESMPSAPSQSVLQVPQQEAAPPSFVPQDLPEHVSKSLKWMQAMGFHNEGGWLSALLLEHNGDINKVMEVMETSSKGDFSSMKA